MVSLKEKLECPQKVIIIVKPPYVDLPTYYTKIFPKLASVYVGLCRFIYVYLETQTAKLICRYNCVGGMTHERM